MTYQTLVSTATLAQNIRDSRWVVFDCRFDLADTGWGRRVYAKGHIPSALYAHLDDSLCSPRTATSGRHPLPDPQGLADWLGKCGVDKDSQVIVYDDRGGAYGSRLWWLLRWLGHDAVALLDGGFQAWTRHGLPVVSQVGQREARDFTPKIRPVLAVGSDAIEQSLGTDRWRLLDARSPERFRGEEEPIDPVAGHIPGSRNLPHESNLDKEGRFQDAASLRRLYEQALAGRQADQTICLCGSGVTACLNLLAMEIAGLKGARLYPGSWSEWIQDADRPVASGGEE